MSVNSALTAAARQCQIAEQIAARRKQNSAFRFNRLVQTIAVDGVTDVERNTIEQAVFDPKRSSAEQMNSAMLINHSLRFNQLEELLEQRFADLIATNNATAMASTSGKTRRILVGNVFQVITISSIFFTVQRLWDPWHNFFDFLIGQTTKGIHQF